MFSWSWFRRSLNLTVSASLLLSTPYPLFAAEKSTPQVPAELQGLQTLMSNDSRLIFWSTLDERDPLAARFILDEATPELLYKVDANSPLVDKDPYFMRSQVWSAAQQPCEGAPGDACAVKSGANLSLQFAGLNKTLNLTGLTFVMNSERYVFLTADTADIFRDKVPGEKKPGSGIFYFNKNELAIAAETNAPIPIFFLPAPGDDWIGDQPNAIVNAGMNQYVFPDRDNVPWEIDHDDVVAMEKASRLNLNVARMFTVMEMNERPTAAVLPKLGITLSFGTQLTGQNPQDKSASTGVKKAIEKIAAQVVPEAQATGPLQTIRQRLVQLIQARASHKPPVDVAASKYLPSQIDPDLHSLTGQPQMPLARANEVEPGESTINDPAPLPPIDTLTEDGGPERSAALEELAKEGESAEAKAPLFSKDWWKSYARRWKPTLVAYGLTAGAAAWCLQNTPIDWSAMFTPNLTQKLVWLGQLMGGVTLIAFGLKHTIYKERLAELYPKSEATFPGSQYAKGFLTVLSQCLHVSLYGFPMTIRQILEYSKDRFFPNNKALHVAWEATMGFSLKTASRITTNWNTALLGWIFLAADSTMVLVDLAIFAQTGFHYMGWDNLGAHTAAFATSVVLQQYLQAFQHGPVAYTEDVKKSKFAPSLEEAKRLLISQGLDPDSPANDSKLQNVTEEILQRHYDAVGLPGEKEFLFDTWFIWQKLVAASGFGADHLENLTEEQKAVLGKQDFVLRRRHLGLITPTLNSAIEEATKIQQTNPSRVGEQVLNLLQWAKGNHGLVKPVIGGLFKSIVSQYGREDLVATVQSSVDAWKAQGEVKSTAKVLKKTFAKYAAINPEISYQMAAQVSQNNSPKVLGALVLSTLKIDEREKARILAIEDSADQLNEVLSQLDSILEQKPTQVRGPNFLGRYLAVTRGVFDHLLSESTKAARDVRGVLFLMSNTDESAALNSRQYLPPTWVNKAGSEEAAGVAAELIHRHFAAYNEKIMKDVRQVDNLEAAFGAEVDAEMAKLDEGAPELVRDPFSRQVRRNFMLSALKRRYDKILKLNKWRPAKESFISRRQWEQSFANAEIKAQAFDDVPTKEWLALAEVYREKSKIPLDNFVAAKWIEEQKYRFLVAREFGLQVGLYMKTPETSNLMQHVISAAVVEAEGALKGPAGVYIKTLSPEDAEVFKAKLFTEALVNDYFAKTADTPQYIKATSSEMPGPFQKARIKMIARWTDQSEFEIPDQRPVRESELPALGAPGYFSQDLVNKTLNAVIPGQSVSGSFNRLVASIRKFEADMSGGQAGLDARLRTILTAESFYLNAPESYRPGLVSMLSRNVPLLPEFIISEIVWSRYLPFLLGPTYLTNKYVFGIDFPYPLWVLTNLLAGGNLMATSLNNRWQRNMDKKPMDGVPEKLLYSRTHSLVTNPQAVFEMAVSEPVMTSVEAAEASAWEACADLLSPSVFKKAN